MKNKETAKRIYLALNNKGAQLGNASIGIIEKELISLQDENKRLREVFVELLNTASFGHTAKIRESKSYWLEQAGINPKEDERGTR